MFQKIAESVSVTSGPGGSAEYYADPIISIGAFDGGCDGGGGGE